MLKEKKDYTLTIRITGSQLDYLKRHSEPYGISVSDFLRRFLQYMVEHENRKTVRND